MGGQSTQFHSNPKARKSNFKNKSTLYAHKTVSNIEDFLLGINAIM